MKKVFISMIALFAIGSSAYSQFVEDALRYLSPNGTFGARTGSLGTSFYGISDDNSALHFNPAGLSLIPRNEFSFGFGFDNINANSNLNSTILGLKSTDAYLSNLSFSSPYKTRNGNAAIAISYNLESNFARSYETNYFNPNSTYIDFQARKGPRFVDDNMAYHLYLSDANLNTPIKDSLNQVSFVKESGGVHAISGGSGFDMNEIFSMGFSLSCKFGSYKYNKEFTEEDINNLYKVNDTLYRDVDFNKLTVNEYINQSFFGITGNIGLMAKISNSLRLSAGIKLPTLYTFNETFSQTANVEFDNGGTVDPEFSTSGENSYSLYTPYTFMGGVSFHMYGLTVAVGMEYTDASQLEFSDGPSELNNLNREMMKSLVGKSTLGIGVEYDVPTLPLVIRGSYNQETSPYADEALTSNIINLGLGVYLAPNIRLDGLFRMYNIDESKSYYENATLNLKSDISVIQAQLTYRF